MVLGSRRRDDAIPVDHPVRPMDELLHAEACRDTFAGGRRGQQLQHGCGTGRRQQVGQRHTGRGVADQILDLALTVNQKRTPLAMARWT
jgi:hypothetical protein